MTSDTITNLKNLGYEVVEACQAPKAEDGTDSEGFWTSYRVRGFGVDLLVHENDQDVWDSLLNTDAHNERVLQDSEHPDQTSERHATTERERLTEEGLPLGALGE